MTSEHPPILAGFEWEFLVALSAQDHHPTDRRWFARPPPPPASVPTPVPVPILGGQRRGAGSRRGSGRAQPQTLTMIPPPPQGPQPMAMAIDSRRRGPPFTHKKVEEVLRSRAASVAVFSRKEIESPPLARDALLGYGLIPKEFVHVEFQAYSVGADNSLHVGDEGSQRWMDGRYQWTGVEVKSRVFGQGEMTPVGPASLVLPGSDGNGESEAGADNSICARELHNVSTALRSNLRLQINQTCAFQVTVSHQTEGGLDLMSLKKIVTLAWILEKPLLFALCAPHRRPGSGNEYCLPITEYSDLAQGAGPVKDEFDFAGMGESRFYWDDLFDRYVGEAVEAFRRDVSSGGSGPEPSASVGSPSRNDGDSDNTWQEISLNREIETLKRHLLTLWRVKTIGGLKHLLNRYMPSPGIAMSSYRLSLAVKCLGFSAPPTNTAVEFRMHEGTLDPVLGKTWGDVCVALVKAATQTSTAAAVQGLAGNSGDGGGEENSGGAFVDTEARAFSGLLRSMLHKTMGADRSASSVSIASTLLRELGISPQQVSLWERKLNHMGSVEATHMSPNQEVEEGQDKEVIKQEDSPPTISAYPDLSELNEDGASGTGFASFANFAPAIASQFFHQAPRPGNLHAPSSSSLQVDVLGEGCTCSAKYTYSSASFLPEVQICTCMGGTMAEHHGTDQQRGNGYGHGRGSGAEGGQGRGYRGPGGEGGHMYGSQQYEGYGQGQGQGGKAAHTAHGGPLGGTGQQEQAAHGGAEQSHVSYSSQPESYASSTPYQAGPSNPHLTEPSNSQHGSWIDPALFPQEQVGQPDSHQVSQPSDSTPELLDGSWIDPALLVQDQGHQDDTSNPHTELQPSDSHPVLIDRIWIDPMEAVHPPERIDHSNPQEEFQSGPEDPNTLNGSWVDPALLDQSDTAQQGSQPSGSTPVDDSLLDPMLNESFDMIDPNLLRRTGVTGVCRN